MGLEPSGEPSRETDREPTKLYVTTDIVAFSVSREGLLQLLLVQRANPPFEGMWALPGGFVEEAEDLEQCCAREVLEETGIEVRFLLQLGVWGKPGRDPRGRNVTIAYMTALRPSEVAVRAGSDAGAAAWHPVDYLPPLAFDHREIVQGAHRRLRSLVQGTHFVYRLLPEEFSVAELREALGAVRTELVTESEALAFLKQCRVVRTPTTMPRGKELYSCATTHFALPLR